MNPQELVAILKEQHRMLQSDLISTLENSKVETRESLEGVVSVLAKFRSDLLAHMKLEGEKFYPDYFEKKIAKGESVENGKKFVKEMDDLAKTIVEFLDKYAIVGSIETSLTDFRKELSAMISTLNVRIETEEEGMFDFYLMM